MMEQRTAQMELLMHHPEDLIPTGHLLKQVDRLVSFEFVYDLVKGSYSEKGRPSIDPVCLIKMLWSVIFMVSWYQIGTPPDQGDFAEYSISLVLRLWNDGQDTRLLYLLRHLQQQMRDIGVGYRRIALDRGYDTGAVHRGLMILGITGYIPRIDFPNSPDKYGFTYEPKKDCFICPEGEVLHFHRLNYNKSTGKYLRCYQTRDDAHLSCPRCETCFDKTGRRRRILASSCYPAFFCGHERVGANEYLSMMRKRKIWSEGSFAVLKREHLLSKIRKWGISNAREECLLSALALNLKRMAAAIFFAFLTQFMLLRKTALGLKWHF